MFGENFATSSSSSSSANNQGLSKGYTPTLSWPTKSGSVSSGTATSGSVSNPYWSVAKVNKGNAQTRPKWQLYNPSSDVISGSSVNKYSVQDGVISKRTRPAQQGTRYAGKYQASSSDQSLPTRSRWSSVQSAAQNPPTAAKVPPSNGQGSSSFGSGIPFRLGTSASAPARRVLANRGSKARKPTDPKRPFGENKFQGSYNPPSPSSMISNGRQTVSWNGQSVAQGPHGFPDSDNSGRGPPSAVHYAPTTTYNIPDQYGGYDIRRLRKPADPTEEGTRKPQQTYTAPPRQREFPRQQRQQSQSVHPKSKVLRIRPGSPPRKYLIIFAVCFWAHSWISNVWCFVFCFCPRCRCRCPEIAFEINVFNQLKSYVCFTLYVILPQPWVSSAIKCAKRCIAKSCNQKLLTIFRIEAAILPHRTSTEHVFVFKP